MKLEEMEKLLEGRISEVVAFNVKESKEALNSLSNAVQALLMVRQEMNRQKALEAKYEAENE